MPRTSAAALYAAYRLFENYDFAVSDRGRLAYPNLEPIQKHVAIFIDYKTQIYQIANLRPELWYWQTVMDTGINDNHIAQQVTCYVGKVVKAIDLIPHYLEEETPEYVTTQAITMTAGAITIRMNLTKAALEAMELLFWNYTITPKSAQHFNDERITRRKVASFLESCLQVGKVMKALPTLRRCEAQLRRGQATADDIIAVLRRVNILFDFLPSFDLYPGTMERDETVLLT